MTAVRIGLIDRVAKELETAEYRLWSVLDQIEDTGDLDDFCDEATQLWYKQYVNNNAPGS